jgi:hypothetical protein
VAARDGRAVVKRFHILLANMPLQKRLSISTEAIAARPTVPRRRRFGGLVYLLSSGWNSRESVQN